MLTYDFSYDEEVEVGDTRPTLEGVWGNTLYYKGFSASVQIRYSFGADAFNSTLFNKVENISSGSITSNQDKRALYDRWKKPGDKAQFKGISLFDYTPMSSRFVMKLYFDRVRAFGILVRQSVAEEKFESFFVEYQRLYEFNRTLLHVRG